MNSKDSNIKDYNIKDFNVKDFNVKDFNVKDSNIKGCNIKGVIIDLDDTLYAYDVCHNYANLQVQQYLEQEMAIDAEQFTIYYEYVKADVKRLLGQTAASHNRILYFQKMSEVLGIKSSQLALKLNDCYWNSYFQKMSLRPGVIQFFEHCQQHKIPVCLLTDLTAEIQFKKVIALNLENYLDYIVTSEEVLYDKPHPLMFFTALHKLQLPAHEVIMIGDSLGKDILGAQLCGMSTVLVKEEIESKHSKNYEEADLVIKDFLGLEKKLWN